MRVDSVLACHCFVIIFILLRDKNAAKTESSIEFTTPSCASLTRGYQQLTHSGSCVVLYVQLLDFLIIKFNRVWAILQLNLKGNSIAALNHCYIRHVILLIKRFDNIQYSFRKKFVIIQ